ncbi:U-box domain-containing protein 43-like, partial [Trifolium pratense]
SYTMPDVQQYIIQTFYALRQWPSSSDIRNKLRKCPSVLVLVKLFENESINLRASAVKLFSCMVESRDEATVLLHVNQKCVETLLKILKSSSDEEEIVSAMGTIRYLPKIEQITQWLLDAGALPIIFPTKLEWQKRAAETGIITSLVQLLESGTAPTKQLAALSLTQFSKSSQELSSPMPKRKGFWH